jgi:hypothetical protein
MRQTVFCAATGITQIIAEITANTTKINFFDICLSILSSLALARREGAHYTSGECNAYAKLKRALEVLHLVD